MPQRHVTAKKNDRMIKIRDNIVGIIIIDDIDSGVVADDDEKSILENGDNGSESLPIIAQSNTFDKSLQ